MFVDAALDAVGVDMVATHDEIADLGAGEEPIAAIRKHAVLDGDVGADLGVDRRRVRAVGAGGAGVVGEGVAWSAAADIESLQVDMRGDDVVRGQIRAADLHHRAALVPVVEGEPRDGAIAADHGPGSGHRVAHAQDHHGRSLRRRRVDDPLGAIGLRTVVDAHQRRGRQGFPGNLCRVRQRLAGADVDDDGEIPGVPDGGRHRLGGFGRGNIRCARVVAAATEDDEERTDGEQTHS